MLLPIDPIFWDLRLFRSGYHHELFTFPKAVVPFYLVLWTFTLASPFIKGSAKFSLLCS